MRAGPPSAPRPSACAAGGARSAAAAGLASSPEWSKAGKPTASEAGSSTRGTVAGRPVGRPLFWEHRASRSCQARPEEAREPTSGTAKGGTLTVLHHGAPDGGMEETDAALVGCREDGEVSERDDPTWLGLGLGLGLVKVRVGVRVKLVSALIQPG